jgi:hypothetical protein
MRVGGKNQYAHRLSWQLAHGAPPTRCVLHKCDNPQCVRPSHLFEGTMADNTADMVRKGRARGGSLPGTRHPNACLSEAKARAVLAAALGGATNQRAIAAQFGVSQVTVSRIARGLAWKHLGSANV